MESPSSCVSTASSSGGNSARNMWNSILELLCHVRLRNLITPLIEDVGLEKLRSLATVPSISFATFQLAPVTNVQWSMAPLPQLQVRGLGLWQPRVLFCSPVRPFFIMSTALLHWKER